MVKRFRKACVNDHVMAKLDGRMGPFNSAREAVEAAAQAGRKLGLTEDELLRFMTQKCKIRCGPLKGMKQEVIIPVVLYLLDDIHIRDDIYWFECKHDQAGFLRYKHTPKRAVHSRRHFGYFNDEQTSAAPPHAVSDDASSAAVITANPSAVPEAAALSVQIASVKVDAPAVGMNAARGAPQHRTSSGGWRRRLGRGFVSSANACCASAKVKIPRKARCEPGTVQ